MFEMASAKQVSDHIASVKYGTMESSEEYESAEGRLQWHHTYRKLIISDDTSEADELLPPAVSEYSESSYASAQKEKWRNLAAYWFLGLTNNFAYVIMLSAAHDILSAEFNNSTLTNPKSYKIMKSDESVSSSLYTNGTTNPRDCNMLSTGTVLLADIIPSLVVKMMAPFIPLFIHFRISAVVLFCTLSFIMVGLAVSSSMAMLGVIFASAAAGLGETTFLAYSANYHQDVISTWSSGTGGAGLFGALSYAALTSLGLSPRQSILLMLIIPLIMTLSFWKVLEHPPHMRCFLSLTRMTTTNQNHQEEDDQPTELIRAPETASILTFDEKLRMLPSLMKFMVPLTLVYIAEYLINQGLSELIYFPDATSWITHEEQYRWYQVLYQIGVLISRSSVNLMYIRKIWITSVLQWLNVLVFLTGAIYWWFGTIWLVFTLILWEGLLGGAAYVNTFYRLSKELSPEHKEFAIQATSMSDTFGITIAGLVAIPLHNAICKLPIS